MGTETNVFNMENDLHIYASADRILVCSEEGESRTILGYDEIRKHGAVCVEY